MTKDAPRTRNTDPADSIKEIVEAALRVAKRTGIHSLTRARIAEELGKSPAHVNKYFNPLSVVKEATLLAAIEAGETALVDAAVKLHETQVIKWSPGALRKARNYLAKRS